MDKKRRVLELDELYNCLHEFIVARVGLTMMIDRNKLYELLGIYYHLPKDRRPIVIRELEIRKILIRIDLNNFRVTPIRYDVDKHRCLLYRKLDFF